MKSLSEVTRWLHVLAATLAIWSQARIEDIFKKLDFANYALVGTVIVAALGILIVDKLAIATIDEFRWLRRILSGKNDIEGDWVDVVAHGTDPCTVLKVEYSRYIQYKVDCRWYDGEEWEQAKILSPGRCSSEVQQPWSLNQARMNPTRPLVSA